MLPTLEEFAQVGAHFGHKKERTHPRAKKFIFGIRDGINIIDLEKTRQMLEKALEIMSQYVKNGKSILFLGTKRQIKDMLKDSAQKISMPYINQRWLGGMLTNFETIRKSIRLLESLEVEIAGEDYKKLSKKERLLIERKRDKLLGSLQGVRALNRLPDMLFIVDTAKEATAVREAIKMNIPIVGICDTDADPELITYPIAANDDAVKSLEMFMNIVTENIFKAKAQPTVIEEKTPEKKPEAKAVKQKTKKTSKRSAKK